MTAKIELSDFHKPLNMGKTKRLPVYVSNAGDKPLIVLHELPGMSLPFVQFCRETAIEGFKVYMPLIFKSPGTEMGKLASRLSV